VRDTHTVMCCSGYWDEMGGHAWVSVNWIGLESVLDRYRRMASRALAVAWGRGIGEDRDRGMGRDRDRD
jgi:hypothetical protein